MPRRKRSKRKHAGDEDEEAIYSSLTAAGGNSSSASSSSDKLSDMCYPDVDEMERQVRFEKDHGLEITLLCHGSPVGSVVLDRIRDRTLTITFTTETTSLNKPCTWLDSNAHVHFLVPEGCGGVCPSDPILVFCDCLFNLYLAPPTSGMELGWGPDVGSLRQISISEDEGLGLDCSTSSTSSTSAIPASRGTLVFNYLEFKYLLETWKRFRKIGVLKPDVELISETIYLEVKNGNETGLKVQIVHLTGREQLKNSMDGNEAS